MITYSGIVTTPKNCDHVWLAYFTCSRFVTQGINNILSKYKYIVYFRQKKKRCLFSYLCKRARLKP